MLNKMVTPVSANADVKDYAEIFNNHESEYLGRNGDVIYGDFRGYNTALFVGTYTPNPTAAHNTRVTQTKQFTYGTAIQVSCGYYPTYGSPNYYSWRYVTIYEDRIEFGQGGYYNYSTGSNINNDDYGNFQGIVLFNYNY